MECHHKSTIFTVSKDKRDTKEGTDKFLKINCIYSGIAKGISQAEVMSNNKIIKSVALAIVKLC